MNNNSNIKNVIGILLIMPLYMLFFVLLNLFDLNNGNNFILLPILMYLPIIFGMILSYKLYKDKVNKLIGISILVFLIFSSYNYYNTYFIDHIDWDGLGSFLLWLINTGICRILSCAFYGKIVGWKKALIFFVIYILLAVSSFALAFWA